MTLDALKMMLLTAILLLVQALILNHIHLFGYGIPLLYVYVVLKYPRRFPKWASLLWAFLTGLCADTFVNTPGVAASSLTFVALVQPYLLESMTDQDYTDNVMPSPKTLGWDKYLWYALLLVLTYTLLFFTIETFTFFNWQQWLLSVTTSSALTMLLIVIVETIHSQH